MGLFTGLQAGGQYLQFREKVSKVYVAILNENPGIENYQIALGTWKAIFEEVGRHDKVAEGPHAVKYYGIVNRVEAAETLTRHLAMTLVLDFKSTRFAKEFETTIKGLLEAQARDGGAQFNKIFRDVNPKSYENFVRLAGGPPFSSRPPDSLIWG